MKKTTTVSELEKPIMRIFDVYKTAVFAKDVDGFIALYDQNVCVFDMWGKWSYNGVEAWRGMVADWFGSLGKDRVAVDVGDVQTIMAHDVAVAYALVTYKGASAEGRELRAMHNRLTWVLKQKDSAWKIVHEHTSAPVDFETSKVILLGPANPVIG
jgi:uncharacterized protein (TIGR02246 family)